MRGGTSKVMLVGASSSSGYDCDVEYLFGHVAIDRPVIDWSGNCGKPTAAVGPFAISRGLVTVTEGVNELRAWQANTRRRLLARVPVRGGEPEVEGGFRMLMDGEVLVPQSVAG